MDEHELLTDYLDAKLAKDLADYRLKEAQERLGEWMATNARKSVSIDSGSGIVTTATYVASTSTKIDEQGLRKALTARVYDKYTDKKLNLKKLEQAMDADQEVAKTVLQYAEVVERAPYLRVSEKVANDV